MDLSKRHLEIIQELIKQKDYVSYEYLSQKFNMSERTIRYDLDRIEDYFKIFKISGIEREREKGVKIVDNTQIQSYLKAFTQIDNTSNYYYSREERQNLIIFKILDSEKPLNLAYFEKYFNLSRNTIMKEFEHVDKIFSKFSLKLIRKPRIGIYVEGTEINRRRAISGIMKSTVELDEVFNYVNSKTMRSKISNIQFNTLFSEFDIEFLNGLIRLAENRLNRNFTDEGYSNLITHIAIMIKRVQLNKEISLVEVEVNDIKDTKEYEVALELTKKIEDMFQVVVPKDEGYYIAIHLLGTKVTEGDILNETGIKQVAEKMLEDIELIYGVEIENNKKEVIENLIRHIRPSIYRIKYNLQIRNPMFASIYKNYNELFNNTKWVCRHLEEYSQEKLNDHEIAYLTLHFGAALEKANRKPIIKPKVVLICATGLGTSQMLATQITNLFDCEIEKIISSRQVEGLKNLNYDYLISTVQIPTISRDDYIQVNTMLYEKDLERLSKYLTAKNKKREKTIDKTVEYLIAAVEKYTTIPDKSRLEYDFMYILKNDFKKINIEEKIHMLQDLLNRETIKLNINAKNWKDAIKKGSDILIQRKDIETGYLEQIYSNFETMGPYMVVAPGIVLAHARPDDGVLRLSMSLITLINPIEFGSELNDPVKLIITLAANDSTSHLKALSQLMNLFMDSEDLQRIINTKDKEEVISIIKKHSQN